MDRAGSEPSSSTRHTNPCSPQPLWASSHLAAAQGREHTSTWPGHTSQLCVVTSGTAGSWGNPTRSRKSMGTQRWAQAAAQSTQESSILGLTERELLGNACPAAGSPWPQARIVSTLCSRECTLASPELSVQSPTSHFFCKACLESQCFMNQAPALSNGSETGMDRSSEHLVQCWRGRLSSQGCLGSLAWASPQLCRVMCRLGDGEGAAVP